MIKTSDALTTLTQAYEAKNGDPAWNTNPAKPKAMTFAVYGEAFSALTKANEAAKVAQAAGYSGVPVLRWDSSWYLGLTKAEKANGTKGSRANRRFKASLKGEARFSVKVTEAGARDVIALADDLMAWLEACDAYRNGQELPEGAETAIQAEIDRKAKKAK